MTILLAIQNDDYSILLSDRRVTPFSSGSSGPNVVKNTGVLTDEYNKTGIIYFIDGIFAFGFTGLAQVYGLNINRWIIDIILKAYSSKCDHETFLKKLKGILNEEYCVIPNIEKLEEENKKITIVFVGRFFTRTEICGRQVILSNFEDFYNMKFYRKPLSEFQDYIFTQNPFSDSIYSYISGYGNWLALKKSQTEEINDLVIKNKPRDAVVGKAISILRKISDSKAAKNNIGKQIYEIFIPHDPKIPPIGKYHTSIPTNKVWTPTVINLAGEKPKVVPELIWTATPKFSDQGPWEVQKVKMDALCPCGSKKKYKDCHFNKKREEISIEL